MRFFLIIGFAAMLACAASSFAEETALTEHRENRLQSLFRNEESGGYVALESKATSISDGAGAGYSAFLLGARGAWEINSHLSIGAAVFHVMNDLNTSNVTDSPVSFVNNKFGMTYGGAYAEYSIDSWRLIHPSASLLVGVGGAQLKDRQSGADTMPNLFFYVAEPQLNGVINLSPAIRAGVSISYRLVHGVFDDPVLHSGNLSGLSGGLFLAAGWF